MPYGTVAESNHFFEAQGMLPAWESFSMDARNAALFRCTWYLDWVYGDRLTGIPINAEEEWGRIGAVDIHGLAIPDGEVPELVKTANYVASLYDLQNPDVLFKTLDPTKHISNSEIGPLKKKFFDNKFGDPIIIQKVESLMRRLISFQPVGILVVQ